MKFGLFIDCHLREGKSQPQAFADGLAQVDAAEAQGYDSVWLAELHFYPERSVLASPLVVAGLIAGRTQRIRIGIAVQVLPLGNPVRIAEEAATLDHLSQGRLDFGIGRSNLTRSYQGFNIPYEESQSRLVEALEIILTAWRGEKFSYQGQFFDFHDVQVMPQPVQRPHPPVFAAVASPASFTAMGQRGFPIFVNPRGPQLRDNLDSYRQAWREAGHPGDGEVHLRVPVYVGETPELAREQPRESVYRGLREMAEARAQSSPSHFLTAEAERATEMDYEEVLAQRVIYGSAAEVVERLARLEQDLGLSGVVMEANYGGQIPQEQVINSIGLMASQVVPHFR